MRRFVFSSVYHPSLSLSNHEGKRPVEQAVYESGLECTVLQPAMFMQLLAGLFADARDTGRISGPYSSASKMCYVDYRDVAEAAALAMTGEALTRGTFELCSPGTFDRVRLAAMMRRTLGRPVEALASDPAAATASMPAGAAREGMLAMMTDYDRHGFPGTTRSLAPLPSSRTAADGAAVRRRTRRLTSLTGREREASA